MLELRADEPLAMAVTGAIRSGDTRCLELLLAENPGLARAVVTDSPRAGCPSSSRSMLHLLADWPGNYASSARIASVLIQAGADENARFIGPHEETPLHWAASCDDVALLDALLDHGADLDVNGAVIAGGTPLADAVAFGQWNAARRLVERGASMTLWQAAALGHVDQLSASFSGEPMPGPEEITNGLGCACHGGQRATAEFLLDKGAALNWIGHDLLTPLDAARRSGANELAAWLEQCGAASATSL